MQAKVSMFYSTFMQLLTALRWMGHNKERLKGQCIPTRAAVLVLGPLEHWLLQSLQAESCTALPAAPTIGRPSARASSWASTSCSSFARSLYLTALMQVIANCTSSESDASLIIGAEVGLRRPQLWVMLSFHKIVTIRSRRLKHAGSHQLVLEASDAGGAAKVQHETTGTKAAKATKEPPPHSHSK